MARGGDFHVKRKGGTCCNFYGLQTQFCLLVPLRAFSQWELLQYVLGY